LHILLTRFVSKSCNTIKIILNKICAADYSEASVEWEEWAVEDSEVPYWGVFVGLHVKDVFQFYVITYHSELKL